LYGELNRRHWRGRLPRYRVLRVERMPARRHGVDGEFLGYADHVSRTVLVKGILADDEFRATLLHEMAHVAVEHLLDEHGCAPGWVPVDGNHGERWRAEVARLVAAGEDCLRGELERFWGEVVS
jgi:hypothetical protein